MACILLGACAVKEEVDGLKLFVERGEGMLPVDHEVTR
jgi:hypothetical protein